MLLQQVPSSIQSVSVLTNGYSIAGYDVIFNGDSKDGIYKFFVSLVAFKKANPSARALIITNSNEKIAYYEGQLDFLFQTYPIPFERDSILLYTLVKVLNAIYKGRISVISVGFVVFDDISVLLVRK